MIAQILAASQPNHVATLTAISSTSGNRNLPQSDPEIANHLLLRGPPARSRDIAIAQGLKSFEAIGTPGEDHVTNGVGKRLGKSFDRCYYPQGRARHLAAVIETGDFSRLVGGISAPTLVLHGTADRLVPITGGRDIVKRVSGARMEELEGMGHDLPPRYIKTIADHIINQVKVPVG